MNNKNRRLILNKSLFLFLKKYKVFNNHNKYFNLKKIIYGDYERYKIYEKPFVIPDNCGYTGVRGEAKDRGRSIRKSINRAKEMIFGYIMSNQFEYWATQTFNEKKVDRFNLDEIIRKYNMKLKNLKRRNYSNLQWLIVPEMHKNGAWHLHMFMSGIPQEKIVYSGYDYFNKAKNFSRKVYNWIDTIDFGFNDYIYIADVEAIEKFRMALYVTKYITKDLVLNRFNKKMYWVSKDLKKPYVQNYLIKNINDFDFKAKNAILTENTYSLVNDETGEIYNTVIDFTIYKPIPF